MTISYGSDCHVHGIDDGLQAIGFTHGSFIKCGSDFFGTNVEWIWHVFRTFNLMNQRFFMGAHVRLLAGLTDSCESGMATLGAAGPCRSERKRSIVLAWAVSSCAMKSLL